MKIQYLLDEQIPTYVGDAIIAIEIAIVVMQVGVDPGAPPKGTSDPDVLIFAERNDLAIVSFDTQTFKKFAEDHLEFGHHTWGVFLFPNGNQLTASKIAKELHFIWDCSEAEEWIDELRFLPL